MSTDEEVLYVGCKSVEACKCDLDLVECMGCGFHLGIDATYLLQVGSVEMRCPVCGNQLTIPGEDLDDED